MGFNVDYPKMWEYPENHPNLFNILIQFGQKLGNKGWGRYKSFFISVKFPNLKCQESSCK